MHKKPDGSHSPYGIKSIKRLQEHIDVEEDYKLQNSDIFIKIISKKAWDRQPGRKMKTVKRFVILSIALDCPVMGKN